MLGVPGQPLPRHLPGVDRDPPASGDRAHCNHLLGTGFPPRDPDVLGPGAAWGMGAGELSGRCQEEAEVSPQGHRVPGVEAAIPASFLRAPPPRRCLRAEKPSILTPMARTRGPEAGEGGKERGGLGQGVRRQLAGRKGRRLAAVGLWSSPRGSPGLPITSRGESEPPELGSQPRPQRWESGL